MDKPNQKKKPKGPPGGQRMPLEEAMELMKQEKEKREKEIEQQRPLKIALFE